MFATKQGTLRCNAVCKCQSQIVHLLESQNVQLLELIIASFFRFQHVYLTF